MFAVTLFANEPLTEHRWTVTLAPSSTLPSKYTRALWFEFTSVTFIPVRSASFAGFAAAVVALAVTAFSLPASFAHADPPPLTRFTRTYTFVPAGSPVSVCSCTLAPSGTVVICEVAFCFQASPFEYHVDHCSSMDSPATPSLSHVAFTLDWERTFKPKCLGGSGAPCSVSVYTHSLGWSFPASTARSRNLTFRPAGTLCL